MNTTTALGAPPEPVAPAAVLANQMRRAAAEFLHVLTGFTMLCAVWPLAIALFATGLGTVPIGIGLIVLAVVVRSARAWGHIERFRARTLLGVDVERPSAALGDGGVLKRSLTDAVGWRALAFLFVQFPLVVLSFGLAVGGYTASLSAATLPVWAPIVEGLQRESGVTPDLWLTMPMHLWGLCLMGLAGFVLTAALVRVPLFLEGLLVQGLLGPSSMTERVRTLEESRSYAVEDSAVTLRRIERDLHDGAQARLVTVTMDLGQAKDVLRDPHASDEQRAQAAEAIGIAHQNTKIALTELRDLARGIHPPVLDSGLSVALQSLASLNPVPVEVRVGLPVRPDQAIETIAYFCVAELLTNVAKHSRAANAAVDVYSDGQRLLVQVRDDGVGGVREERGSGVRGLIDRVRTVDGELSVDSVHGGPTIVTIDLPLRA